MAKEKVVLTLPEVKDKLQSLGSDDEKKGFLKGLLTDDDYKKMKREVVKDLVPLILKKPATQYELVYDSFGEGLEPIYYWCLDFMRDSGPGGLGLDVFKGPEEYEASVSSGYFGEIGQRATLMQQKSMEYLGAINQVIKSILNLLYDLKEFEIRLGFYDKLKSDDPETKRGASFALKGIWMDTVDIKKGKGSINMLAQDLGFVTIRDAFFYVETKERIKALDLNDRVKKILERKFAEYSEWREKSEFEIRKRYQIEKAYLRSQIGTLKLYAAWAKPYLRAAQKLQMKEFNVPDIVNNFSNIELQLALLGKKEVKAASIHESYKEVDIGKKYYAVIAVEMDFRGVPSAVQTQQGRQYVHGGRANLKFKAYAMDEVELSAVESRELYEDMDLVDEWVDVSLKELQTEVDEYLNPKKDEGAKKPEVQKFENPFKGTIEGFSSIAAPLKDAVQFFYKSSTPDSVIEQDLKGHTQGMAETLCGVLYNVYKKSHGMLAV